MTADIRHLIGGRWLAGSGDPVRSVNPTRPHVVVAEGGAALAADVDAALRPRRGPPRRGRARRS
ncbi:aldehyde dehydrogenase, partial [Mycobacterium rufum]|nr:aldehyde dehydrogenase [Mycolicibacterium rufum]